MNMTALASCVALPCLSKHLMKVMNNECTKVQNPRCHRVHIMRMRAVCRKMAMAFNEGSAGPLQRSIFRENPTNFLRYPVST